MFKLDKRSVALASLVIATTAVPRLGGQSRSDAAAGAPRATVTFARDIAPILYEHCAPCHRPGGWGPFSLLTYGEVRPHARQIADLVRRRVMPPWKPEPDHGGPFVGERRLSDDQIVRIQRWVSDGAQAGAAADLMPMPAFHDEGWQLGVPDLVVGMPRPYNLPAGSRDNFRNFVIPIPVSETRYVRGLELLPDNRTVAHHANMRIDQTGGSRRLDEQDLEPGYNGIVAPSAAYPDGHLLGWTPGQIAPLLPPGMAWRLQPGSSLVVQMHMPRTDTPQSLQLRVGLYFTDTPPARAPAMLRIGLKNIDIPPGESHYVVSDSFVLPVDVEVHAIQPHAHLLAKEIRGYATLPDGTRRWLMYIKAWDFHWQDVYRYRDPFWLPKGTTLHMEYSYDNSARNHPDRDVPVKRVRFGQQTSDEMADLWIQVLPRDRNDWGILTRDYLPKEHAKDIVGYQMMLVGTPDDASIHDSLAKSYIALGFVNEAIGHLRESVRLQPTSDVAHYNFATALTAAGQFEEAASNFRRAIELNPTDAYAHNNLGALLHRTGRTDDALREFREAVRIDPMYVNAQNNVGIALYETGRIDEAVEQYQRAVQISPNNPALHYGLGNALKLRGGLDGAISAYMRTLALDPDHERASFDLATVFEARAQYREAMTYYRRALALKAGERSTMTRMAWILATAPEPDLRNPDEAIGLAQRAAAIAGRDEPVALDVLAASYAASGQFDLAIAHAERALAGLTGAPNAALAAEIGSRLALYRDRKAYRAPGTSR